MKRFTHIMSVDIRPVAAFILAGALVLASPVLMARTIRVHYINQGPSPRPVSIDLPVGARIIGGRVNVMAHSGGSAPYTLTAVTLDINGKQVNPDTHRIAPSQIRGFGTLRCVGAGETKTFKWDLSRILVANPNRAATGSIVVDLRNQFHPGRNEISIHTSVGSNSWVRGEIVLRLAESAHTIR